MVKNYLIHALTTMENKISFGMLFVSFFEGCLLGGWGSFHELYLDPETFFREERYRFLLGFLSDGRGLYYRESFWFFVVAFSILIFTFNMNKRICRATAFLLGFLWGGIGSVFIWRVPL